MKFKQNILLCPFSSLVPKGKEFRNTTVKQRLGHCFLLCCSFPDPDPEMVTVQCPGYCDEVKGVGLKVIWKVIV